MKPHFVPTRRGEFSIKVSHVLQRWPVSDSQPVHFAGLSWYRGLRKTMDSGKSCRGQISRQRQMQSAIGTDNANNTQNAQKFPSPSARIERKYTVNKMTRRIVKMNMTKYLVLCVRMRTDIHQSKGAQHALRMMMQLIRLPKYLFSITRSPYRSRLRKSEFVITAWTDHKSWSMPLSVKIIVNSKA